MDESARFFWVINLVLGQGIPFGTKLKEDDTPKKKEDDDYKVLE